MIRYTKEQLIHYLKKLSSELKRTPKIKDMNKKKKFPSSATYYNRFGSWNTALKKVGLKINLRKKYDKKELIENLRLLAKDLGRKPKTTDLNKKSWMPSYTTYRKYFGSWKKALRAANLHKREEFTVLRVFSKKK